MERLGSSQSGGAMPGNVWGRTSFLGGFDGDDGSVRADSKGDPAEAGGPERPSERTEAAGPPTMSIFAAGVLIGVLVALDLRGECARFNGIHGCCLHLCLIPNT